MSTDAAPNAPRADRAVATWLIVCAAFVAAMVVVGGLTRLTRSGLSITEWNPVTGVLPPMSDAAWGEAFARYRASPEGRLVNAGMSMDGFRSIFLVEWAHRLLGRITGLVFGAPLVWFALKRRITRRQVTAWVGLFALGGVQGVVGWYMVKSGLVDEPHVSPYRLTAHLLVALVLFALLVWSALDALGLRAPRAPVPARAAGLARATLALAGATVAWGGLMAGHHAGLYAPTFPTMNGALVPAGMFPRSPAAVNLVATPLAVHFTHRALAYVTAVAAVAAAASCAGRGVPARARMFSAWLLIAVAAQVLLGALTVLRLVPISLASLHQANAVVLLAASVALVHALPRAARR